MTHTLNNGYIAVEVPEGSETFEIDGLEHISYWNEKSKEWEGQDLPPGSWSIVCLQSEVTEAVAKGVVERHRDFIGFDGYKNYGKGFSPLDENFDTALESFHSLMASKNIKHSVILKQK